DEDGAAVLVGERDDIAKDRAEAAAAFGRLRVEGLDEGVAFRARGADEVIWVTRRPVWPDAVELLGFEQFLERLEGWLGQLHFGHAVADTEVFFPGRVAIEPVGIRSLDDVHAARVVGLAAVEEALGRAATGTFQIGGFERVDIWALGE